MQEELRLKFFFIARLKAFHWRWEIGPTSIECDALHWIDLTWGSFSGSLGGSTRRVKVAEIDQIGYNWEMTRLIVIIFGVC